MSTLNFEPFARIEEVEARIEALEAALRKIADYSENGDFGPAWDEIEEARNIARAALDKDAG
jgi:hypothetical protein